ncbi:hypothetical protein LguiA_028260 [Lonicera macranthoides]
MNDTRARVLPENPMATSSSSNSMTSTLKAYSIPFLLFSASIFFQLFVIPTSFPPSHYDVLGINQYSPIEQVNEAYQKFSSNWNSGIEAPSTIDFIKIRYAFELLRNQLWKRDYDIFGIDEQVHVIDKAKEQYAEANFSEIVLPLLEPASFDPLDHAFDVIRSENLRSTLENSSSLLVQVFSLGSNRCAQFFNNWKRIANLLDGVANTGMVELGDVKLATYLAEKKYTGQPFFRNGLPSLIAFPPGCRMSDCLVRYAGAHSIDAVTDWFATSILSLPRIPFYSRESLVQNFLGKGSRHKVKVIFISKTGERATPFVRQAAKSYWAYASFAFALWREEESSFWWNMFGVESAPAIVFLRDPGVKPVVHHGMFLCLHPVSFSFVFQLLMLPQLRSVTSMELGCDARGYSRAGNDTMVWYCVVLAGRLSPELEKMRETMRRVQEILSNDVDAVPQDSASSAIALKEKRLTFTWLDGEAQNRYCSFYLHSEHSFETCGPRRDMTDVARLFIVRYKRTDEDSEKIEEVPKSYFAAVLNTDMDPTSQLVATYNGSEEIPQIIQWMSQVIKDGDSKDLPFFRTKTPPLVPEDADPIWSRGTDKILSSSMGMKHRIGNVINKIYDQLGDPRIGPVLLLAALISFGSIWLRRSQSARPSEPNNSIQPDVKDDQRRKRRSHPKSLSKQDLPPSITDEEPKDAVQAQFSDSDSE